MDAPPSAVMMLVVLAILIGAAGGFVACSVAGALFGVGLALAGHD